MVDIICANETGTITSLQNAGKMNTTAIRDAIFGHGNITTKSNLIPSSYGDNPDASLHGYLVICALLGIITMIFNGLLLYCICYFPYLHTPTNTLVASVCIADLLGGFQQFFGVATGYYIGRSGWAKLCLTGKIIKMFSIVGKMWSIVGVSINSYLYICKPLRYQNWMTIERILKITAILWTYNITAVIITMLKFNHLVSGMPCIAVKFLDPIAFNIPVLPPFICLATSLPLCYSVIAVVSWQQRKRRTQQIAPAEASTSNAASDSTAEAVDWKIVKMMALVTEIYLLSMFPSTLFSFVNNYPLPRKTLVYMDRAVFIMWSTQYWVNPLIYAWKNVDFRRAMKTVLSIRSRRIDIQAEQAEPGPV